MDQNKILKKAKDIIAERKLKSGYIEICLTADLCPNCGEPGEPERRQRSDTYEIYKFRCKHCFASYLKPASRSDGWIEKD